jgi:hypothetical protein
MGAVPSPFVSRSTHRSAGPLTALFVALAVVASVALPAAAQDPVPTTAPPAEPSGPLAPLSARFPARGTTPATAVSQLSVEQGAPDADPIVVVGFAQGFVLPGDGYAVRANFGRPGAERVRASLVVEGGSPTGRLERGDGAAWQDQGATRASFDASGVARIEVPADLVADKVAVWVEIDEGTTTVAGTPIFSWGDLRGESEPAHLGVSDFGVVTDGSLVPTGDIVEAGPGPSVAYANGSITISFPGPAPTDLRGNPAVAVIDYLRLGTAPAQGGLPPFYVTIDHVSGQVLLWDGSSGLPTPVPADPATWVIQGLGPPDPADPSAAPGEVVLSLDGLSQAIGVGVDDSAFAMGIARSVALADARIVTFDGVTGLLTWFEGSAAATLPPIEDDIAELEPVPTAPPPRDDDRGSNPTPWILLGLVVALAVVGAVVWLVRRQDSEGDTFTPQGTAPPRAGEPGVEPVGDAPPPVRAAGVSPDQALSALQRTVEEVTAKLDESVADQAMVKVSGEADRPVGRRATTPGPATGVAAPAQPGAAPAEASGSSDGDATSDSAEP